MKLFSIILHLFWPSDKTFHDDTSASPNVDVNVHIPPSFIEKPVKTETIENKIDAIKAKVDAIERKIDVTDSKVDSIKAKVDSEIKAKAHEPKIKSPEPEIEPANVEIKSPEPKDEPSRIKIKSSEPKSERIDTLELANRYLSLSFESEPITRELNHLTIYSASYFYSGMRGIIHRFKYEGKKNLCIPLGRAMSMLFTKPEIDYLIPVPLHINSTRKYNQSYELAKGMSEQWNIKVIEAAEWATEIEHRVKLNAHERMKLKAEDFRITHDVSGLKVSIIDDVCTTGATLLRLSEALENHGAIVVCAYALSAVGE